MKSIPSSLSESTPSTVKPPTLSSQQLPMTSNFQSQNTISTQLNSQNTTDNMRVAIRIRPALTREMEKGIPFRSIALTNKENKSVSLVEYIGAELDEAGRQREWVQSPQMFQMHRYTFDEVFDINTSQEEVYNCTAKPAVYSVLEGYNSTIFAYGQTGTGKTFTMEGFTYDNLDSSRGIIPRTIEDIFKYIESNSNRDTKFIIRAAYLQIYNEMISDLLKPNSPNKNLNIREDKKKGLYVEHLSEWAVRGPNDIYALLERGASCRAISNTNMNDVSSRSHAVFMIIVEQLINDNEINGQQITKIGRLNLVDLAGSERTRVTGATGKQLEESKKINKSLSALGNVINALTDPKGRTHIPYRDSKLTRLLENSLGGNCKTTMIATISPAQCSFNESLSTLNFAKRAKNIKNRPVINEDIDHNALIHQYENELKKIRKELEEKTKLIASNEEILEQKNREEKAKNDAIKAYERASRQLFIERDEKQKLEAKIKVMNLQMITGGQKLEETPQFKNALQEKQVMLEKDFEQKLMEIEREREQIEDSKAQVEAYNKLLYKQRDIMDNLSSRLKEKEESINIYLKQIEDLNKKLTESNQIIQVRNDYIDELENILEENKISYKKDSSNFRMNLTIPSTQSARNKIYIPYEAEQNGKEYSDKTIPLLSSEEKIKELNDIVSNKDKEITLLKRISEKIFDTSNDVSLKEKFKQLEDENLQLSQQISEKNQMINLQRQENESLEQYYQSMEKIYHSTEKENLKLINIKENLISSLDEIIKKIDSCDYNEIEIQTLRTDLVKVFQILLDGNCDTINTNSNNLDTEEGNNNNDDDLNINNMYLNPTGINSNQNNHNINVENLNLTEEEEDKDIYYDKRSNINNNLNNNLSVNIANVTAVNNFNKNNNNLTINNNNNNRRENPFPNNTIKNIKITSIAHGKK